MHLDQNVLLAAASDWIAALLFLGLLLGWWGFLAWWLSRWGARGVEVMFHSPKPPDAALRDWTDYYGIWLAGAGYQVVDQRSGRLAYVGQYRPRWEVAIAVLLFPIGLLALLGTLPAHLVVTTVPGGILVSGTMHRRMAKELEGDAATGVLAESAPYAAALTTPS